MRRTLLLTLAPAALIAWNWLRLEDGRPPLGQVAWVVALALAPVLLPRLSLRLLAVPLVFALAAHAALSLAFDRHFAGRIGSRFARGVLDSYDTRLPFAREAHPRVHGVLLLAVFGFCLAVALCVAARRPVLASVALLVGVGWPGTVLNGDELKRGALLLAVVLSLLLGLTERPARRLTAAAATGVLIVLAALAASTSSAVAKNELLDWRAWDFYTRPAKPVGVSYVWNSDYRGFAFPRKRTTVLQVEAPPRSTYWRATTLNAYLEGGWREDPLVRYVVGDPSGSLIQYEVLLPRARNTRNWVRQEVTVEALRDKHLVGANMPVAYQDVGFTGVAYTDGGALVGKELRRGTHYTVFSYLPRPTPRQLARSRPDYPTLIARDRFYLQIGRGLNAPPLGTRGREAELASDLREIPELRPYRTFYETARRVVGGRPASPYAAAIALEGWLREGDFVYDQRPPLSPGLPPLVDFVTRTRRGYCQHFAGAMALMLRYLGVPARVAAGFTSGRYDAKSGTWQITDHEAHTWVEVWFRGYGWIPFDPTPGRGELSGRYTAASPVFDVAGARSALKTSSGARPAFDPGTVRGGERTSGQFPLVRDLPRRGLGRGAETGGGSVLRDLFELLGLALAGALALVIGIKVAVRLGRRLPRNPRRVALACRRNLIDFLLDQGAKLPPSATLGEVGVAIESGFGVDAGEFVATTSAARYGPPETAAEAAARAPRELREVRRRLRRELTVFERAWGLVSLRSLGLSG